MATPYRGYTEVPGLIAPDVPYRINLALREIDADLETALAELDETDAAAAGRLAALESAAGFGSGMKLQDDAVNALLLSSTSKTTATLAKQIDSKATAATLKALDTEGTPLREALDAFTLEHLAANYRGPLEAWGQAIRNHTTAPALWVNLGSSTANGGNTANFGLSWAGRIATYLTGRDVLNDAVESLDAAPARPANGIHVYNGAVGGTTSGNYLNTAKLAAIKKLQPTLITHMVGANDLGGSVAPATYKTNLRNWMDQLQAASPNTVHLYIHQQGRVAASPKYPWADYGDAMREVAEAYPNVAFLDAGSRFQATQAGLAPHLVSDNLHMNLRGHRIMADLVAEAMGHPIAYAHEEFYPMTLGASGSTTTNAWSFVDVPPAPYPRTLTLNASIYAYGTGGSPNGEAVDLHLKCYYSGGPAPIDAGSILALRVTNGGASYARQATAAKTWHIDANRPVRAEINNVAGAYVSGNAAYSAADVTLRPI